MNNQYVYFSAKDLCTRSCMQIKMFREKPELKPKPNMNQWKGCDFQHEIAKTLDNVVGEEMGGCVQDDNLLIYFANDIICTDKIIEVKSIDENREVDDWYLKSCFLQCAIYKTLTHYCKNKLKTASFHVQNGNKYVECVVGDYTPFILYFGKDKYIITVMNYEPILKFVLRKAKHSLEWDSAKQFDSKYKGKEYETLKNYFHVLKV